MESRACRNKAEKSWCDCPIRSPTSYFLALRMLFAPVPHWRSPHGTFPGRAAQPQTLRFRKSLRRLIMAQGQVRCCRRALSATCGVPCQPSLATPRANALAQRVGTPRQARGPTSPYGSARRAQRVPSLPELRGLSGISDLQNIGARAPALLDFAVKRRVPRGPKRSIKGSLFSKR